MVYNDGTNTWLDLDSWIVGTGQDNVYNPHDYLGDTFLNYCIATDPQTGLGLYNNENWCISTYNHNADWCLENHSSQVSEAVDYESDDINLDFEGGGNYTIISYPMEAKFRNNINADNTNCNFLKTLELSYSGEFQEGDTLILMRGGDSQKIIKYSGEREQWDAGGSSSLWLSVFDNNPSLGILFQAHDEGTQEINWRVWGDCLSSGGEA